MKTIGFQLRQQNQVKMWNMSQTQDQNAYFLSKNGFFDLNSLQKFTLH